MNIGDNFKLIIHDADRCTITPMVVTDVVSSQGIHPAILMGDVEETHVNGDWDIE